MDILSQSVDVSQPLLSHLSDLTQVTNEVGLGSGDSAPLELPTVISFINGRHEVDNFKIRNSSTLQNHF